MRTANGMWAVLLLLSVAPGGNAQQPPLRATPCPKVLTDLVPGLHADTDSAALAHVEIRRCAASGGSIQIVAWKAGIRVPSLVLDVARFGVGPILMDGNVFAMVFPGPYDSVVVIRYSKGEPKVEFTDSTHDVITMRTTSKGVEVALEDTEGKRKVRVFDVDEEQLAADR